MGWAVNTPNGQYSLDDMTLQVAEDIATKHGIGSFLTLISTPGANRAAFADVLQVAFEAKGATPPAPAVTIGDYKRLLELLEIVAEDVPSEFEDGNPLADGADPETT